MARERRRPPSSRPAGGLAAALLAPLFLVGVIGAVAVAFRRPAHKRGPAGGLRYRSLPTLRNAILGNTKTAVAAALGPPRTATVLGAIPAGVSVAPIYLHADTWYYALDLADRSAMAIKFEEDRASEVEFFRSRIR